MNRVMACLRTLATLGFFFVALVCGKSLLKVGSGSVKSTGMNMMFRIEWGDGPGKFRYQESEMGFESDTFPRKYVRDRQGNFYFLEPGPPARLSKFSSDGRLVNLLDLAKIFPALTPNDVITPQELFLQLDGNIAALLRVYLNVEERKEIYLAYFNPAGTLKTIVQFPHFKLGSFHLDNASFLDKDGHLWVLNDGGVCDVYGPTGELVQSFPPAGSFVDRDGRLYFGFNPLKLYGRGVEKAEQILYEGHSVPGEPEEIDGANSTGFLYSWRHLDKIRQGEVTAIPRTLNFYRLIMRHGKFEYVGEATLPPSKYRHPNPRSDYVERTELYENRLVFDDAGNVYFLGRSPKECWIERVQLEIK